MVHILKLIYDGVLYVNLGFQGDDGTLGVTRHHRLLRGVQGNNTRRQVNGLGGIGGRDRLLHGRHHAHVGLLPLLVFRKINGQIIQVA